MFAGSCIGVIALVCSLEFLRRLAREYDRYVVGRKATSCVGEPLIGPDDAVATQGLKKANASAVERASNSSNSTGHHGSRGLLSGIRNIGSARPTVLQQLIRSLIHMFQFAVAYFIMLLAMYYNGYIIFCIFIGAFVGSFVFGWDLAPKPEPSGCCG